MPGHPEPLTASTGPISGAALVVATEVAARVADPAQVTRAVSAATAQTAHPGSVHWRPHAVGQGHAGLALLFGALDSNRPGHGWDRTAHRHLELAARAAERQPRLPAGLFAGLAGLGLVAACLAADTGRYRRLLAHVDQALVPRATALARRVGGPAGSGGQVAGYGVDLISGLTGIAAYLLLRRTEPGPAAALRQVLASLVALSGAERSQLPGYPDCGLAHGVPGPLAVLALALRNGPEVPGLRDTVARTAAWVASRRISDPYGPNWPGAVPAAPGPARAAWCYGGPGVAAALRLAGEALDHRGHRELAVAALQAALAKPAEVRRTASPTFCHGQAGLLAVAATFARATGHPGFAAAAAGLTADLLDRFDPAAPLGYRDLEAGGRPVDQPGLLTGAPGVALALLGVTAPAEPAWARLFLLA